MTDEQLRLEALKLAEKHCKGDDRSEVLWCAKQFLKFLKGETND